MAPPLSSHGAKPSKLDFQVKETTKAMGRRLTEADSGGFPWPDIFKGDMLDVGSGDDPLNNRTPLGQCWRIVKNEKIKSR